MVHATAVYALAGGLGRVDANAPKANSVFFNFQKVNPNYVSTLIGKNLPGSFTAKSLRKGAVTEMENHPDTNHENTTARSGHATGNDVASSSYFVRTITSSLPGGKALCEYANVHARVHMATLPLEILPRQDEYIDKLFFINITPFIGEGRLVPLLPHLLASLIQYYNKMTSDGYTTNNCPTINKLVTGVMEVEGVVASVAMEKLRGWSAEVQSSFTANNAMALGCLHNNDDIKEILKSNGLVLTQVLQKLERLERSGSNVELGMDRLNGNVVDFTMSPNGSTQTVLKRSIEPNMNLTVEGGSSSSSSTSSYKRVKQDGDKNAKQPNIDKVLEDAVRAGGVVGEGSDFCLQFCMGMCGGSNNYSKVRTTMGFVYDRIEAKEMTVLKDGDPKNDNDKTVLLKTVCSAILARVVASILVIQGKEVASKNESWTLISIASKVKPKKAKQVDEEVVV
jgi:hypothetical protein